MSPLDMRSALLEWPHDPEQVSVRKIVGGDGVVRVQMRVELGLLQLEVNGRPDGLRPHDCETLLTYHREELRQHEERNGTALGFALTPKECLDLRVEGSQFYRRYVALFVLEEYPGVFRDTTHTLELFDFCKQYALENDDQNCLEPYRPYVLMMDARARAYQSLKENENASAMAHVNRGLLQIRTHLEERGQSEAIENCQEMKVLQQLGTEIAKKMPQDSLIVQHRELRAAIAQERFEDAARLRDAMRGNRDRRER